MRITHLNLLFCIYFTPTKRSSREITLALICHSLYSTEGNGKTGASSYVLNSARKSASHTNRTLANTPNAGTNCLSQFMKKEYARLRRTNTKNHECVEERRSRGSSLRIPQKLSQKDKKVHCGDAIENHQWIVTSDFWVIKAKLCPAQITERKCWCQPSDLEKLTISFDFPTSFFFIKKLTNPDLPGRKTCGVVRIAENQTSQTSLSTYISQQQNNLVYERWCSSPPMFSRTTDGYGEAGVLLCILGKN